MALMLPAFVLAGLAWTGWVRYWHVAALAGMIGVVNALDMPSRQSFLVEMVGREDLLNAIALNSATFNAARVAGPALGGSSSRATARRVAFLLNALSFLAVLLTLGGVRAGSDAAAAPGHDDPPGAPGRPPLRDADAARRPDPGPRRSRSAPSP